MRMRTKGSQVLRTELWKDLLFPARCPICSDVILFPRRMSMHTGDRMDFQKMYRGLVCDECRDRLTFIVPPYCRKCGKQLDLQNADTSSLCADCAGVLRQFEQCRCLTIYDETAREILAGVKYLYKKEYIDLFAVMAADRLGDWVHKCAPDYLIPVPVHNSRLRERGFNQAEVLADALSGLIGIPVKKDILIRKKNTTAQKSLGAQDRLMNLQNAFVCSGTIENGTKVMVIDDIYTTGATLEACTEQLLRAGAEKVYGLCLSAGES